MDENVPKKETLATTPSAAPREAPNVPRLRTYASDISRVIRARGETLTSIVSAEKKAEEKKKPAAPPASGASYLMLAGAIVLPLIGVAAIVGTLVITAEPKETASLPAGIIFSNSTELVPDDGTKSLSDTLSDKRAAANLLLGEIQRFVLVREGVPLSPPEIARVMGLPEGATREVVGAMVGIHSFNYNQPFAIFEVITYDRTFNALLEWEPLAARSLGPFFAPRSAPNPVPRLTFSDKVIQNLDVRESEKTWPILYAFPTRTMLVVTTNEFTLREIMTRLGNANRE